MAKKQPLLTETSFRVRYAETDMMGVVHHASYIVYLEEGRSALSRQHDAPYSRLEEMGYSLALSDVNVRYRVSARYDNLITIRAWISEIKSRGIVFAYEVINADSGELLVTGQTKHICLDHAGRVQRIPEEWIAPLKRKFDADTSTE